jgi:hypothetical protein
MPSGMKIRSRAKVLVQGGLGIFPDAEEVDLGADLPAPLSVVVGCERK